MKKRLLMGLLLLTYTLPAMAQTSPDTGKIFLESGFLSGYKYEQAGYDEPLPVYGFLGLSFKPEFEKTLAIYPPALTKANEALVFNGVKLLLSVGALVILTSDLLAAIDRANHPGSADVQIRLLPFLGLAAGAMVSGFIGTSQLKKGVRMYNENIGAATAPPQSTAVSTAGAPTFGFKAGLNMANQKREARTATLSIQFGYSF